MMFDLRDPEAASCRREYHRTRSSQAVTSRHERLSQVQYCRRPQVAVGRFDCCQTTGLNRDAVGAYSRDVRIPTRFGGAKR